MTEPSWSGEGPISNHVRREQSIAPGHATVGPSTPGGRDEPTCPDPPDGPGIVDLPAPGAGRRSADRQLRCHRLDAARQPAGADDEPARPGPVLRRPGPQQERAVGA